MTPGRDLVPHSPTIGNQLNGMGRRLYGRARTGLLAAPLPPDGSLPVVSATTEEPVTSTASRSSRSQDGKVLVYGLLLTVQE